MTISKVIYDNYRISKTAFVLDYRVLPKDKTFIDKLKIKSPSKYWEMFVLGDGSIMTNQIPEPESYVEFVTFNSSNGVWKMTIDDNGVLYGNVL